MAEVYLGSVYATMELRTDKWQQGLAQAQSQLDGASSGIYNKLSGIADGLENVGKKLSIGLSVPLGLFTKQSIDAAVSFDRVMRQIAVASGEGEAAIAKLRPIIEETAKKGVFSLEQVAQATRDMVKDGLTPAEIATGQLAAAYNLAVAAGEDLYDSQVAMSNVMFAFGDGVDQAARYSDIFTNILNGTQLELTDFAEAMKYASPIANALGMSAEQTAAAIGAIGQAGIKGSMGGTTLKRALLELAAPTDRAQEWMDKLGVAVFDSAGNMKDFNVIVKEFAGALNGSSQVIQTVGGRTEEQNARLKKLQQTYRSTAESIEDYSTGVKGASMSDEARKKKIEELTSTQRNLQTEIGKLSGITGKQIKVSKEWSQQEKMAALDVIFGAHAVAGMTAIIGDEGKAIDALLGSLEDKGRAERDAAEASKGLAYESQKMKTNFDLLKVSIGEQFAPVIGALAGLMEKVTQAFDASSPAFKQFTAIMLAIGVAIGPVLIGLAGLIKAFVFVGTTLGITAGALLGVIGVIGLVAVAVGGLWALFGRGGEEVNKFKAVFEGAGTVMDNFNQKIAGFKGAFQERLYDAFNLDPEQVQLHGFFNEMWAKAQPALDNIVAQIRQGFENAFSMFGEGGEGGNFGDFAGRIQAIFEPIADLFYRLLTPAIESFKQAWIQAKPHIDVLLQQLGPIFVNILYLLATAIGIVTAVFLALFSGILQGIAGALPGLMQFFAGVAEMVSGFVQIVVGVFNLFYETLKALATGNFSQLGEIWKRGLTTIWEGVKTMMKGIFDTFVGFFTSITGAVKGFISGVIDFFKNLYDVLVGHSIVPDMMREILALFTALPGQAYSALVSLIQRVTSVFTQAWSAVVSEISTWPGKLKQWGENIARSFVDGFSKLGDWLKEKAQAALNAVKGILEGHSPPKEGPFKHIDRWGQAVGMAWVDGFGGAFSSLAGVLSNTMPAPQLAYVTSSGVEPQSGFGTQRTITNSPTFNVNVGIYAGSEMEKRALAKQLHDAYLNFERGQGNFEG